MSEPYRKFVEIKERSWKVYVGTFISSNSCLIHMQGTQEKKEFDKPVVAQFRTNTELKQGSEELIEDENFLNFEYIYSALDSFKNHGIGVENFIEYSTGFIFFGVHQIFSHFNLSENKSYYSKCLTICLRLIDCILALFSNPNLKFTEKGTQTQKNEYNKGWQELANLLDLILSNPETIMDYRTCENLEYYHKDIKDYWSLVDPAYATSIISHHLQTKSCIRFFYSIKPFFAKLETKGNLVNLFLHYLKDENLDLKNYDQNLTLEFFYLLISNNDLDSWTEFVSVSLKLFTRSEKLLQQKEILKFVEANCQYLQNFENPEKILRCCFGHESLPKLAKNLIMKVFQSNPKELEKIGKVIQDEIIFIEFLEFFFYFFEYFQKDEYKEFFFKLEAMKSQRKEEFIKKFVNFALWKYGTSETIEILGNSKIVIKGLLFQGHLLHELAFIRSFTGSFRKSKICLEVLSEFVTKCDYQALKLIDSKTNVLMSLLYQMNHAEFVEKVLITKIVECCDKKRLVSNFSRFNQRISRAISLEIIRGNFDEYARECYYLLKNMEHPRLNVLTYLLTKSNISNDFSEFAFILGKFLKADLSKNHKKMVSFISEYIQNNIEYLEDTIQYLKKCFHESQKNNMVNMNLLIIEIIKIIPKSLVYSTTSLGTNKKYIPKNKSFALLDEMISNIKTPEFYEAIAQLTRSKTLYSFSSQNSLIENLLSLSNFQQLKETGAENLLKIKIQEIFETFKRFVYIPVISQYLIEIIVCYEICDDDQIAFECIWTLSKARDNELNENLKTREIISKPTQIIRKKSNLEEYLLISLDFKGNQVIDSSIFFSVNILSLETSFDPKESIYRLDNQDFYDTLEAFFFKNFSKLLENDGIAYMFELLINLQKNRFSNQNIQNIIKSIDSNSEFLTMAQKPITKNIFKLISSIKFWEISEQLNQSVLFDWIFNKKIIKHEETLLEGFRVFFKMLKECNQKEAEILKFTQHSLSIFNSLRISDKRNHKALMNGLTLLEKGLKNFGNTCYINSVIQLLNRIKPLVKLIIESPKKIDYLRNLLIEMNFSIEASANIKEFLTVFKFNEEIINTLQQQDADDFFKSLFQTLEEIFKTDFDTFQTEILDSYSCRSCNLKLKEQKDRYFILNLDIFPDCTVFQALNKFLSSKKADQVCSKCGKSLKITRKVLNTPDYLGITLNRFYFNSDLNTTVKIFDKCKMNETLNLAANEYILDSFIVHIGNSDNGHYVSFVRSSDDGWVLCNDDSVTFYPTEQFSFENLNSLNATLFSTNEKSTPYILLYKKKSLDSRDFQLNFIQNDQKFLEIKRNNDYFYNIFIFFQPHLFDIVPKEFYDFQVHYVFIVGVYMENSNEILESFNQIEDIELSDYFTKFLVNNSEKISEALICAVDESTKLIVSNLVFEKIKSLQRDELESYLNGTLNFLEKFPHTFIDFTIVIDLVLKILEIIPRAKDLQNYFIKKLIIFNACTQNSEIQCLVTNMMKPTNFESLYLFIIRNSRNLDVNQELLLHIKSLAGQLQTPSVNELFARVLFSLNSDQNDQIAVTIRLLASNDVFYLLFTFIMTLPEKTCDTNMDVIVKETFRRLFENHEQLISTINNFRNCYNIPNYIQKLRDFIRNYPLSTIPKDQADQYHTFLMSVLTALA